MALSKKTINAFGLILKEFAHANKTYEPYNSAHEGFAFLKEEVDELWEEIKKKPQDYDMEAMTKEAAQIGAVALRFLIHVCLKEGQA